MPSTSWFRHRVPYHEPTPFEIASGRWICENGVWKRKRWVRE